MKFSLRPEHQAEDELFSPLRDIRSPLSTEAIKTIVSDRMAIGYSLWGQLRGLIGEFLAVGVVSAIVINFSGFRPAENARFENAGISKPITATNTLIPDASAKYHSGFNIIRSHTIVRNLTPAPSVVLPLDSTPNISNVSHFRSVNEAPTACLNREINYSLESPSSNQMPETGAEWFSTLSSGAVFSHIRMLGEDAEVGIQSGWKSIGLSVANANGNRDMHDVLEHHSTASSLLFSENNQTIAILFGANYSIGPLNCKAELGPAYLFSSTTYVDPATSTLSPGVIANHLGAAAKISAFYKINDFFQAGVTGISSYQTGQFTNGVFLSVSIQP